MRPRQLLAGLVFCLGWTAWAAPPDPRLTDLRLEEQISQAQGLCVEAGKAYQKWFNGRMSGQPARELVTSNLAGLEAFQNAAARLAVPRAQAAVRHWARLQKQELNFFLRDIQPKSQKPTQAELQQRWENAVEIQSDLLKTRRQQLEVVKAVSGSASLAAYYRWKESLLRMQDEELQLARQVAAAFQQHGSLDGVPMKALTLKARVEALKAPTPCLKAQALYVQRFEALTSLCRAAEEAIGSHEQSSLEFLQDNEEIYRQKTLASDDASLAALRALLLKTR